jgi:hypothetical protein
MIMANEGTILAFAWREYKTKNNQWPSQDLKQAPPKHSSKLLPLH